MNFRTGVILFSMLLVFTTVLQATEVENKDNAPRPKYFIITIKKNQIQHSYLHRYMLCDNY